MSRTPLTDRRHPRAIVTAGVLCGRHVSIFEKTVHVHGADAVTTNTVYYQQHGGKQQDFLKWAAGVNKSFGPQDPGLEITVTDEGVVRYVCKLFKSFFAEKWNWLRRVVDFLLKKLRIKRPARQSSVDSTNETSESNTSATPADHTETPRTTEDASSQQPVPSTSATPAENTSETPHPEPNTTN